jgi:hypothetical protein
MMAADADEITPLRPSGQTGYLTTGSSSTDENTETSPSDSDGHNAPEINDAARHSIESEHEMSFIEAAKLYPGAIGWSIFFSLGIIMTAFDSQLLGNLYATPAFQRDFGYLFNGKYIISAGWQTMLGMGSPIGQVFGALCAAYPMEWFGRKKVIKIGLVPNASR